MEEEITGRRVSTSDSDISDGWNVIDAVEILPTEEISDAVEVLPTEISDAESVEVLHEEFSSEPETEKKSDDAKKKLRVRKLTAATTPELSTPLVTPEVTSFSLKELCEVSAVLAVLAAIALSSSYMLLALEDTFFADSNLALFDGVLPSEYEKEQLSHTVQSLQLEYRKLNQKLIEIDKAYNALKRATIEKSYARNIDADDNPIPNHVDASVNVPNESESPADSGILPPISNDFQNIKKSISQYDTNYKSNPLNDAYMNTQYIISIINSFKNSSDSDNSIKLLHKFQDYFDILRLLSNDQMSKQFHDKWENKLSRVSDNLKNDVNNILSKLLRHVNRTIVNVQTNFISKLCNKYWQGDDFKYEIDVLLTNRLKDICPNKSLKEMKKESHNQRSTTSVKKTATNSEKLDEFSKSDFREDSLINNDKEKYAYDSGDMQLDGTKKKRGYQQESKNKKNGEHSSRIKDDGEKVHSEVNNDSNDSEMVCNVNEEKTNFDHKHGIKSENYKERSDERVFDKKYQNNVDKKGQKLTDGKKHSKKVGKSGGSEKNTLKKNGDCMLSDDKKMDNDKYYDGHTFKDFEKDEQKHRDGFVKDNRYQNEKKYKDIKKNNLKTRYEDKGEGNLKQNNKFGHDDVDKRNDDYHSTYEKKDRKKGMQSKPKDSGGKNKYVEDNNHKFRGNNLKESNKEEGKNKEKRFVINNSKEYKNNYKYEDGPKYSKDEIKKLSGNKKVVASDGKENKNSKMKESKVETYRDNKKKLEQETDGKNNINGKHLKERIYENKYKSDDKFKRGEIKERNENWNYVISKKNKNLEVKNDKYNTALNKKNQNHGSTGYRNRVNSSSETWFLSMGKLREQMRFENHRSDWLFDRAKARRNNKRDTNNWFFDRAWARHRRRINPKPTWWFSSYTYDAAR